MKKKSDTKVIFISNFPLPYNGIGSWTTSYSQYLLNKNPKKTYVICPKFEQKSKYNIKYSLYNDINFSKIVNKIYKNRFHNVLKALDKILSLDKNSKYVVHVIDNFGLIKFLSDYLIKKRFRDKVYIQYAFHGYLLDVANHQTQKSLNLLDELILLTQSSYHSHLNNFSVLPPYVSVLQNGINTKLFNVKSRKLNDNKIIFLWCSQDRPKKGLHIILELWDDFHKKYNNTELWIVGNPNNFEGKGVKNFGRMENDKLPEIYKKADVYLFPTLCQEGFGLTLAEALHCGCFCIASNLGGVPDVLNYGEYGWLIDSPHDPKKWYEAMEKYINTKPQANKIPINLYSIETWSTNMNSILKNATQRLENKTY